MEGGAVLCPHPGNVVAKVIDGEAIVIDLATGSYYSLRGTGAAVWSWLGTGASLATMARRLASHYGRDATATASDLVRLAIDLERAGLVAPDTAPGPGNLPPVTLPDAYAAPAVEAFHDMQELLALDPPLPLPSPSVPRGQ